MLQLKASFLALVGIFVWQCSDVQGNQLDGIAEQDFFATDEVALPEEPAQTLLLHQRGGVSSAAAADWMEKALWGPEGASRWRHHGGLLDAHRLRLDRLEMLNLLPKHTRNSSSDWDAAPTQPPPPRPSTTPAPATEVDTAQDSADDTGPDDDSDDEGADYLAATSAAKDDADADNDAEDVLSAGLRVEALARERTEEEKRAAAAKKRAARDKRRKAMLAHRALVARRKAKRRRARSAKAAEQRRVHKLALKRSGSAVQQINGMLKQVVEELELEKSRCHTYMGAAKKEATDAREISMEDQERMARIESLMHASEAEKADIDSQNVEIEEELKAHKTRCVASVQQLRAELKTLETDAATTARLMSASPCKGKALLLECYRHGMRKPVIASRHGGLRSVMAQLTTPTARRALQRALRRAFKPSDGEAALVQRSARHRRLRRGAARRLRGRREERCRAAKADCKAVEAAIVLMMADVQDKQHTTKVALDLAKSECEAETKDLELESAHLLLRKQTLRSHEAQAVAEKSGISGGISLRLGNYQRLTRGLTEVGKECEKSLKAYERQACTLRQSRVDVFVNNGIEITPDMLRDCEVSPWAPAESCSEECGGGEQWLIRTVVVPAGPKGMPCPALKTKRACNVQSCPVDCKVSEWTPWTECSAICGGGTRSRNRRMLRMAEHGGETCPGENDNMEPCNMQPCVPDCKLGSWLPWSPCTRACDGGFHKRVRIVSEPAQGNALCPTAEQRSEYKRCRPQACPTPKKGDTLKCNSAVDLTIILDGSSHVSKEQFGETQSFATSLIKSLNLGVGKGDAAIILAGGPKTWKDFEKCKRHGSSKGALAACNVALKLSFTESESAATAAVGGLKAPGGPAYTAAALSIAADQVDQGRGHAANGDRGIDAAPVVLVVAHGRPLSESRTSDEAAVVRAKARLMWVVVGGEGTRVLTADQVLSENHGGSSWASRPFSDNVFQVDSAKALNSLSKVSEIISAICPSIQGLKVNATR